MNSKKILALKIFIGCLFLFSGLTKLFPILAFEIQLIVHGITSWFVVTWLSRLVIAFEIFLGLSFFQKNFLKQFFIPAATGLLIIFSLDLIRQIILRGFDGDCGCFGQVLTMSPFEASFKNIILISALIYLNRLLDARSSKNILFPVSFLLISFFPVFLLFPPRQFQIETGNSKQTSSFNYSNNKPSNNSIGNSNTNLEGQKKPAVKKISTITSIKNFSDGIKSDLTKGENIVAMLSMNCGSCTEAGLEIGQLKNEINLPPVYYLLFGEQNQLNEFFSKTKIKFPYKILDEENFFILAKGSAPRVFLLRNGKIIYEWDSRNFSGDNLKAALSKL